MDYIGLLYSIDSARTICYPAHGGKNRPPEKTRRKARNLRDAICHLVGAARVRGLPIDRRTGDMVIGVDGGCASLQRFGIPYDAAIGDFDSLGYVPAAKKVLAFPPEKDYTDTLIALRYALTLGYGRFALYGCLGGALSHALANVQSLAFLARHGARGVLVGEDCRVAFIKDGALRLTLGAGAKISVLAFGGAARGVEIQGLKYALSGGTLTPDRPIGVSNESLGAAATISVESGALVVVVEGAMPAPSELLL
jgi:thiamine pyrophosphokinase